MIKKLKKKGKKIHSFKLFDEKGIVKKRKRVKVQTPEA